MPGFAGLVGEIRDDDVRLRLAVAVVDGHAPPLLEHGDDLGIEKVAGRDEAAEARGAEPLQLRVLREDAVLGGGVAENARAEPEEEVEAFVGVELAVVKHYFGAARPRPRTVFHIVSGEVASEVHHTASPRRRRASARPGREWRKTEPCVWATSFRGPAAPDVDTMKARSRDAVSWVGTSTGTSFEFRLTPSVKSWMSGVKPIFSIVDSKAFSAMTSAASVDETIRSSLAGTPRARRARRWPPP